MVGVGKITEERVGPLGPHRSTSPTSHIKIPRMITLGSTPRATPPEGARGPGLGLAADGSPSLPAAASEGKQRGAEVWVYHLKDDAPTPVTEADLAAALETHLYTAAARCSGPALEGHRHPIAAAFWQIRRREQAAGVDWLPGAECRGGITGDLFAYLSNGSKCTMYFFGSLLTVVSFLAPKNI